MTTDRAHGQNMPFDPSTTAALLTAAQQMQGSLGGLEAARVRVRAAAPATRGSVGGPFVHRSTPLAHTSAQASCFLKKIVKRHACAS